LDTGRSLLGLLAALAVVESQRAGRKVGPQEAVMLLNRDEAVVVDIREKKEFSEGHIKGAIHIPMAKLKESDNQLRKHSDKLILMVDKAGQHSGMAVKELPQGPQPERGEAIGWDDGMAQRQPAGHHQVGSAGHRR